MEAITVEQRNYLVRRLDEITQEKIEAKAKELYGDSGRPESPTWAMVFAAIRAGEITLKEGTEDNTRPYLMPNDVEWPAMEAKKKELEDYRQQLTVERKRLMDGIMLAGATGAAEALASYQQL